MRFFRALLLCVAAASPVLGNHNLDPTPFPLLGTAAEIFKDPNGGFTSNGINAAQLDLNVQSFCPKALVVQVHFPKTFPEVVAATPAGQPVTTNAGFDSSPVGNFPNIVIDGYTSHGGPSVLSKLDISWDNTAKILTFSGFNKAESNSAAFLTDPLNGWVNIHFDIQPEDFYNPQSTVATPTPAVPETHNRLPLSLYRLTGAPTEGNNVINLNLKNYFHVFEVEALTSDCTRPNPTRPGGSGDPVFSGFQGQQYQFHGLPDEHFNLVSSPDVQVNSHFVYLSSGKCDYNDTECYTHPGTYMDVLGFSVADAHVKVVAGTHAAGLRVWVNDAELQKGAHIRQLSTNTTSSLRYHHNGRLEINTEVINFEVVNSDMFMNIRAALNSHELLRVGATKHTVTDAAICKSNSETHNHQLVEQTVAKKYPVTSQLHGLIGQTWRNVKVCGHDWMGTVQDYIVSDLFASDNHYTYFKW